MRVKITLSYNGAAFHGLQVQSHTDNTVMGALYKALERLGITGKLHASGRTDRGVHASAQVMHLDLPENWNDPAKLKRVLNRQLESSIHIKKVETADPEFHARYGAKKRLYRYIISDREPNPFEADFVTFAETVDFKKIAHAIRRFEGEHDFSYFMKTGSDTPHAVRTIYRAFAYRHRGHTVLCFEANGFLRAQIRMMTGMLLGISQGRYSEENLAEQLACKQRHCTKPAPHNGLYLAKIRY